LPGFLRREFASIQQAANRIPVLPKEAIHTGTKVDTKYPTYPWCDILGLVVPKAVGVGTPTLAAYAGGNVKQLWFAAADSIDFEYHIPHDYVPGSDVHVHIHWSHNDAVSITGNAVFDLYHQYAKGHNQAVFGAEKNITLTYATVNLATTPQYQHRIDEVQLSTNGGSATLIDSAALEPDGLILLNLKMTTLPTFGGAGNLFVHHVDVHYQSTGIGTKQKSPDFYV
jgi:hypothetical protein